MKKYLVSLAILLAVFTPTGDASAATFRVVGTGDSILHLVRPSIGAPDRWFDTEQGRDAYTPGNMGRASTLTIWPTVLRSSQPGGWVIIQDNGMHVTESRWRDLMRLIVTQLPDNRCLLGVFPVYLARFDQALSTDAARKATIMAQEFSRQPCHSFVYWNSAVLANSNLVYDGQHPNTYGIQWLAARINRIVG